MARYLTLIVAAFLTLASILFAAFSFPLSWIPAAAFGALLALGIWDLSQRRHSLLRNYPILGHLRWLFEGIRPEIRQYLVESDLDAVPFSREKRSLVYQRAKDEVDSVPFGTELDVYDAGFSWITHSLRPKTAPHHDFRVSIGGPDCASPYSASIYNISAMSFGSLGANAIRALNKGAKLGNFAHDTGEGSISRYHREGGGDLIWQIASGYFGCRTAEGSFDPKRYEDQAAADQVKMIEIKLSQGAKPGHGGVLPGVKVTREISEARGIPIGVTCISPAGHNAFSTPLEFVAFIQQLRELSRGKPVGFKLCVGHPWEFLAIVKAMVETGITPDYIVVDGKEGGTGAAPLEFLNRVGTPLVEGLNFVHNALIGAGLRDRVRIGAAGKVITAFDIVWAMGLGADWCNSARGFMFALGCIQAQACHTNRCPVGIATQDPVRQRALVVEDKAKRVAAFHRNTLKALADVVSAAGLDSPAAVKSDMLQVRQKTGDVIPANEAYPLLAEGELLAGTDNPMFRKYWALARSETFTPTI